MATVSVDGFWAGFWSVFPNFIAFLLYAAAGFFSVQVDTRKILKLAGILIVTGGIAALLFVESAAYDLGYMSAVVLMLICGFSLCYNAKKYLNWSHDRGEAE
tara:strand:+ start:1840 stop:2145 length:306 start_codon:yes stop_codon:yes gene_type:complete